MGDAGRIIKRASNVERPNPNIRTATITKVNGNGTINVIVGTSKISNVPLSSIPGPARLKVGMSVTLQYVGRNKNAPIAIVESAGAGMRTAEEAGEKQWRYYVKVGSCSPVLWVYPWPTVGYPGGIPSTRLEFSDNPSIGCVSYSPDTRKFATGDTWHRLVAADAPDQDLEPGQIVNWILAVESPFSRNDQRRVGSLSIKKVEVLDDGTEREEKIEEVAPTVVYGSGWNQKMLGHIIENYAVCPNGLCRTYRLSPKDDIYTCAESPSLAGCPPAPPGYITEYLPCAVNIAVSCAWPGTPSSYAYVAYSLSEGCHGFKQENWDGSEFDVWGARQDASIHEGFGGFIYVTGGLVTLVEGSFVLP